jgi:23S rRNA pseudoU1915 N3-methylase RlmH
MKTVWSKVVWFGFFLALAFPSAVSAATSKAKPLTTQELNMIKRDTEEAWKRLTTSIPGKVPQEIREIEAKQKSLCEDRKKIKRANDKSLEGIQDLNKLVKQFDGLQKKKCSLIVASLPNDFQVKFKRVREKMEKILADLKDKKIDEEQADSQMRRCEDEASDIWWKALPDVTQTSVSKIMDILKGRRVSELGNTLTEEGMLPVRFIILGPYPLDYSEDKTNDGAKTS